MNATNLIFYLRKKKPTELLTFGDIEKNIFPATDSEIHEALQRIYGEHTDPTIKLLAFRAENLTEESKEFLSQLKKGGLSSVPEINCDVLAKLKQVAALDPYIKEILTNAGLLSKEKATLQIIDILKKWRDNWPTHDELTLELNKKGIKIGANEVTVKLAKIMKTKPFQNFDELTRKRIIRARYLSYVTRAVLLAVEKGNKDCSSIASAADRILKNSSPKAETKVRPRAIDYYMRTLKNLAKEDTEVKTILQKLTKK